MYYIKQKQWSKDQNGVIHDREVKIAKFKGGKV